MGIGLGATVGLWMISGAAFWCAFVALGLGFRPADEAEGASARRSDAPAASPAPARNTPEHVLARSRR